MKLIQKNLSTILIVLAFIFTTNIFCMRMTQSQKETAQKYMRQIKTAPYQKASQKYMQQIKTEVETTKKPVIFYSPFNKKIELNFVKDNTLIKTPLSPIQVSSYSLSPQKKYLLFQITESKPIAVKTLKEGIIEQGISFALSKLLKRPIGEQVKTTPISTSINLTKIVDLQTQTEIGSFDGDLITYEFSPDEKTVLISRRHMSNKLGNKGALALGSRPRSDTTRYELFDTTSKSVIKNFENVDAINYTAEDTLHVQYDNHEVEKITIQRDAPSLSQQVMNIFLPRSSIQIIETKGSSQDIPNKITYYDAKKELHVNLFNKTPKSYADITAYALSPLKNYLVLMKEQAVMNLIDMHTGQNIENICANTITYEFSPGQKETRLVVLGSTRDLFSGKKLQYSLVNLEKDRARTLGTFSTDNKTYYFKSADELIVADKNGTLTPYNPQTGISFEKEQQEKIKQQEEQQQKLQKTLEKKEAEKAQQRNEELNKQQQELQTAYEESLGIMQPAEKQIQKEDKREQLKKAEQREDELIKQQQELQKAYEESLEAMQPAEKQTQKEDESNLDTILSYFFTTPQEQIKLRQQKFIEKELAKEKTRRQEQAQQRNEKLNKQQQELQKAYEESLGVMQPAEKQAESAFDYIKSFWTTPSQQIPTTIEKKKENITDLMNNFFQNQSKNDVIAIINKLSKDDNPRDLKEFVKKYSTSWDTIKKQFASYFFVAPHGVLQPSSNTLYTAGMKFDVSVVENRLQISNNNNQELVFTSNELDHQVKVMAFSANDEYLAVSYEDKLEFDIFKKQNNTFVLLHPTLVQKLQLETDNPIIGFKFITTKNNKTYLFFIDTQYQIRIFDLTEKEDFYEYSKKSTSQRI